MRRPLQRVVAVVLVDADDLPEAFVRALYGLPGDVPVWSRSDALQRAAAEKARYWDDPTRLQPAVIFP